ncbi:MAG: hypothetical protein EXR58_03795 [Chloroflexi bacterium]|nr:hypothetical protein [Chloroflexota bacterium]
MSVISRILRRVLLRLVRLSIRRRRVLLVGTLAVVGLVIAGTFGLGSRFGLALPNPGDLRPRADGEPSATAQYLKGQEVYDAHMVWDSYSERVLREAQQRGLSLDDTQRQLDRARQVGTKIEQIDYIGGYPIPNGSMHFYVVFRSDPSRREAVPVPYVFTLDGSGKIDAVE